MYTRIKDLREDKDMSQTEVADYLSISQTTYSRYETGKLDIATDSLKKLALMHDVSTDYLLNLTDEIKPYPRKNKIS